MDLKFKSNNKRIPYLQQMIENKVTTWAEPSKEIARARGFVLTGFLKPGNHIFMTFEHDCSAQIFPEYSDLILILRAFFF